MFHFSIIYGVLFVEEKDNKGILEKAKADGVKFVQLQFTDIHGAIKSVTIPIHRLAESLEKGTWFDGSSIEGFTRIAESDMYLKPDASTYALLPWETGEESTVRIICDVYTPDDKPFEGDPRYILKKVLKEALELGYEFKVGPELEFFLFKPREDGELVPTAHDKAGYFDFSPKDLAIKVRRDIIKALESMGMEIETAHHEVAPGQHEISFKYGGALETADRAITFKHVVKSIAQKHDLYATFMPKPIFGENGSGMHVHQSLFKDGKNVFFDADDEYKLSDIAKSFIAGQLEHVKAMAAIVAPKVNSYKRLVPGYEAPVYICWAQKNRSALIRVPRYSPGREQSTRIELRCPDPSCNPYLAFAVMLKAGLDGVKNKMKAPEPVEEDVYEFDEAKLETRKIDMLPASLGQAILKLKKDTVIQEALGEHACPIYIAAKKAEFDEYRLQVTKWEMEKYFEST